MGRITRFTAKFKGFDGTYVNPSVVKFIIYDSKLNVLNTISVTSILSDGITYYTEYAFTAEGNYIVEYYAEVDGLIGLVRGIVNVKFI